MDSINNFQQGMSDPDLFTGALKNIVTDVFMVIDPLKLKQEEKEFGPYLRYLRKSSVSVPSQETVASMSHYFIHDGLFYKTN